MPARLVARIGGTGQSRHTRPLALALIGSVLASCLTPYGPGLLVYDVGVSDNGQIGKYISEWNSPDFHSLAVLVVFLVPLAVLVACVWLRRLPVLEASLAAVLFVEALRTQRLVVYLMLVAVGLAASLPVRPAWDTTARRWAGAGLVVLGIVVLAVPSVPAGSVSPALPVQAFDYLEPAPGPDLHRVHLGRLFDRPPPRHLRRRADRPVRRPRADRVLRRQRPDHESRSDPRARITCATSCGRRARRCREYLLA